MSPKQPHRPLTGKVQLAVIPPIAYLRDFANTGFHLVLAHLLRASPSYFSYYFWRHCEGDFVIMDNGAAEQGIAINDEELYNLAMELKPDVMVCPDALTMGSVTIQRTMSFLEKYSKELTLHGILQMAVPQGKTKDEWVECFNMFNSDPRLSWLGISKYIVGAFDHRVDALKLIAPSVRKKCHLLGLAENTTTILEEKNFNFVKSTDSAVPVKLGMQSLRIDQYNEKKLLTDEDFFFGAPRLSFETYQQVMNNIDEYRRYCK